MLCRPHPQPATRSLPVPRDCTIHQTYISIWHQSFLQILQQVSDSASTSFQFNITIFCVDISGHVSYKTLKVYLAAIRLVHLEHDLDDPTNDHLLHLVCKGIRRLQGDSTHQRLPITINLLKTLKTQQARSTSFSPLEQKLLWAAFSLAFYGFMRVSEFTTPATSNTFSPPSLHWTTFQLHITNFTPVKNQPFSTRPSDCHHSH